MTAAECRGPQIAVVDLSLIGDPELGALDLRVAMAVAACLNGKSREGQTTEEVLVALTGSTRAKVSAAISNLERREHLTVLRQRGVAGRYFPNRYRMPVNAGSLAYVPLAWAFHPAMARDTPTLKALIFCAKEANRNGLFLLNASLRRNHPESRIQQFAVAAGYDIRTAARGWKKLVQMGALNGGLAPLATTNDGDVMVDWDAVDPARLTYDPNELDLAGSFHVMHLSRPPHYWPAVGQQSRNAALGYMAGILGVHGEHSQGARRTTSGDAVNHLGGQNQPRSHSPASSSPGISATGLLPSARAHKNPRSSCRQQNLSGALPHDGNATGQANEKNMLSRK